MGLVEELEAEHADLPPTSDEVPPMPDWVRQWPVSASEPPRCECGAVCFPGPAVDEPVFTLTRSPELLADRFAMEWLALQRQTARMWRAAAAMHAATGAVSAEFVGDDLALLTNTHPRSGATLLVTAVGVCEVPELLALVERGELSTRHATALLTE
ncbi:MAG TPA: hypothetical protein VM097_06545, partial [Mycobacteriales bacterium]|nr:hypothetical protein [Mycobacteriales bacterium]